MGGRRARPASKVLGTRVGIQAFNDAVDENADPKDVAALGANVLLHSDRFPDVFYYLSRLASEVASAAESGRISTPDERNAFATRAWSSLKQREQIPDDPITTRAIVDAISKALERGRR